MRGVPLPGRARRTVMVLAACGAVAVPHAVAAQAAPSAGVARAAPRVLPELRLDAFAGTRDALHVGAGGVVRLGTYARAVLVAAGGAARVDGERRGAGRVEGVARFLLDPLRERRLGAYGGAGVSAAWIDGDGWRTPLVVVFGVEGPARRGRALAAELGLGGGVRLGVVLRGASGGRR